MDARLLKPFAKLIDRTPAGAIAAVVEREGQMLADDLVHGRALPERETRSILSFCRFLKAVQSGTEISPVVLPVADTAFYRRTTERMVQAGKLPGNARERFDLIFTKSALNWLSSTV